MAKVRLAGPPAEAMGAPARATLTARLEGAPLERGVLLTVVRRAFQEAEVAVDGLAPDDLVRALLDAREQAATG
jgi:hypothetical protein